MVNKVFKMVAITLLILFLLVVIAGVRLSYVTDAYQKQRCDTINILASNKELMSQLIVWSENLVNRKDVLEFMGYIGEARLIDLAKLNLSQDIDWDSAGLDPLMTNVVLNGIQKNEPKLLTQKEVISVSFRNARNLLTISLTDSSELEAAVPDSYFTQVSETVYVYCAP